MKPSSLQSSMPGAMDTLPANVTDRAPKDAAEARKVALQFEGILLKEVVSSLRKTANVMGEGSGGHPMYDHMMEQALTDHLAASGGVGLAQLFEPSLVRQATTGPAVAETLFGDLNIAPVSSSELDTDMGIDLEPPITNEGWQIGTPLSDQLPASEDRWLTIGPIRDRLERILRSGEPGISLVDEKKLK
ncbi:MAG: Rod binding domain-containing protein [Myxococcota bacterium]|jgi:Rod binding domain-containing protein